MRAVILWTALALGVALWLRPLEARACGCLSPPVVEVGDFAVNQQSEQILFEVEGGYVTAHVLIRYAGDPAQFAWLVPVPSVPELGISPSELFGFLEETTGPRFNVQERSICPEARYTCRYHERPERCLPPEDGNNGEGPCCDNGWDAQDAAGGDFGSGDAGAEEPLPGGVEIARREKIGAYETVTFSAQDAGGAVRWLQDEGFLVNETMTPYMQPYLDAGMYFLASKLISGAGADEIQPLRMRFEAERPMIPLQLTAVAAEPHLTVTAYIMGQSDFQPAEQPLVTLDAEALSWDRAGRVNYPMLLARAIDEAGGDAFVAEFYGALPSLPFVNQSSNCCGMLDTCGVEGDGQCQCPGAAFDRADCVAAGGEGLVEAVALWGELSRRHSRLTRLTTRLSPEEMSFDPVFAPTPPGLDRRLSLANRVASLRHCEEDVIDQNRYRAVQERQDCASIYCGVGACVVTRQGAGCDCGEGYVARGFQDLDGEPSVTCTPAQGPVALTAEGVTLPDACAGVDCGQGRCVDVGGFAACACEEGAGAALRGDGAALTCALITQPTQSAGGDNYADALLDLAVCAPASPMCGARGWLVPATSTGRACMSNEPAPALLVPPPAPSCEDFGWRTPPMGSDEPGGDGVLGAQPDERQERGCGVSLGAPSRGLLGPLAALLGLARRAHW